MQNKPPDTVCVQSLRNGDNSAWSRFFELFDDYIDSVVAWPKWHFDAHLRKDVAQTIKMDIVKSVSRLKDDSSLKTFVKRICVHKCIDEIRRQVNERNVVSSMYVPDKEGDWKHIDMGAGKDFDPIHIITMMERAGALKKLLEKVTQSCRTMLKQFYGQGSSYKEIAEALELSVNTVGSRLSKCLNKLRELIVNDPILGK